MLFGEKGLALPSPYGSQIPVIEFATLRALNFIVLADKNHCTENATNNNRASDQADEEVY